MAEKIVTYDMLGDGEGSGKDWVDKHEPLIKIEIIRVFALFLISLASPIVLGFLRPESQDAAFWFQRSGSIMVVLALLAELRVLAVESLVIARSNSFLYCHIYIEQKYNLKLKIINCISYFVIALGTLIWGFGDVFYPAVVSSFNCL